MHELYDTKADASYNLHATLGHMPYSRIERMVRKRIWNGYSYDRKFLKDMLNVRCDICLRAKITDASHTGQLYRATRPWRTFSFDVTDRLQQHLFMAIITRVL